MVVHAGVWRIETVSAWAKIVGEKGRVIIVESEQQNCDILRFECDRRNIKNVEIINKAVWSKPQKMTLNVSKISAWNMVEETAANIQKFSDRFVETQLVDADTIDNIVSQLNTKQIDHLFLSVNGAEIEAFIGARECLKSGNTTATIHCPRRGKTDSNTAIIEISTLIKQLGLNYTIKYKNPMDLGQKSDGKKAVFFVYP